MATNQTPLDRFLEAHGLTQTAFAAEADMALSQVNALVRGHYRPRTDTVNRLLDACRKYDPAVTYEDLFGSNGAAA